MKGIYTLFVTAAAAFLLTAGQAQAGLVVSDAANDSNGPASSDILSVAINNGSSAYDVSMTLADAPTLPIGFYGVLFSANPTISTETGAVYATMPTNVTAVNLMTNYFTFGGVTPTISSNTLTWHIDGTTAANNDSSLYALLQSGSYSFTGVSGMLTNPAVYDTTTTKTVTPIPGAAWLFGTGLLGLIGLRRRTQATSA